jgi:membrane associated rhomboid family serine protease
MTAITFIYFYFGLALFDLLMETRNPIRINWQRQVILSAIILFNLAVMILWWDRTIPFWTLIVGGVLFLWFDILPFVLNLANRDRLTRKSTVGRVRRRLWLRYLCTLTFYYKIDYRLAQIFEAYLTDHAERAEHYCTELIEAATEPVAKKHVAQTLFLVYGLRQEFHKIHQLAADFDITIDEHTDPQAVLWLHRAYCEEGDLESAHETMIWIASRAEGISDGNHIMALLWYFALSGDVDGIDHVVAGYPRFFQSLAQSSPYLITYWKGRAHFRREEFDQAQRYFEDTLKKIRNRDEYLHHVVLDYLVLCQTHTAKPIPLHPNPTHIGHWKKWISEQRSSLSSREEPLRKPLSITSFTIFGTLTLLLIYAAMEATGQYASQLNLYKMGMLQVYAVAQGEYWRLIAACFLHGDMWHLFFNGMGLFILAWTLERAFGVRNLVLIFILSAVLGNVVSFGYAYLDGNLGRLSLGSSGGVFGLLGALSIFVVLRSRQLPTTRKNFMVLAIVFIVVYSVLYGFVEQMVDNHAHIGGLVSGALLALILPLKVVHQQQTWKRIMRWVGFLLSLVVLGYGILEFVLYQTQDSPILTEVVEDSVIPLTVDFPKVPYITETSQEMGVTRRVYEWERPFLQLFSKVEAWKKIPGEMEGDPNFKQMKTWVETDWFKQNIGGIAFSLAELSGRDIQMGDQTLTTNLILYATQHQGWLIQFIYEMPASLRDSYEPLIHKQLESVDIPGYVLPDPLNQHDVEPQSSTSP